MKKSERTEVSLPPAMDAADKRAKKRKIVDANVVHPKENVTMLFYELLDPGPHLKYLGTKETRHGTAYLYADQFDTFTSTSADKSSVDKSSADKSSADMSATGTETTSMEDILDAFEKKMNQTPKFEDDILFNIIVATWLTILRNKIGDQNNHTEDIKRYEKCQLMLNVLCQRKQGETDIEAMMRYIQDQPDSKTLRKRLLKAKDKSEPYKRLKKGLKKHMKN